MEKLALCRVCFNVDFNIQKSIRDMIENTDLEIVYEKLTSMPTEDRRPGAMCYMCYAQLRNVNKFRLKCLRAEDLLTEMLNQILDNEEEIDNKANLIQRLRLSSALSVSRTVTVSSTDDNDVESEVEDVEIKQELLDDQDVKAEDTCAPESPDVTVAHKNVKLEKIWDEQEHSPAVSCKSDESRSTLAPAPSVGDEEYEHMEYSNDHPYEVPVLNQPETESQNKSSEVVSCIKDTKYENNDSDIVKPEEPTISKFNDIPFTCKVCNISFSHRYKLTNHNTQNHTGDKLFICDVCSKRFTIKRYLVEHVRIHMDNSLFTCKVCKKGFSRKHNLARHVRIHTGKKPFTCNVCNRRFTQQHSLIGHARTHTGEKPFICNDCNKSFTDKSNLVKHVRTHTGDKPYTCNVCNKRFTAKRNFAKHIQFRVCELR